MKEKIIEILIVGLVVTLLGFMTLAIKNKNDLTKLQITETKLSIQLLKLELNKQ